jgi:hypothetical protein
VSDIVTVMTPTGEYVGQLVSQDGNTVVIKDPRIFMANQQGAGFTDRIAMTGKENPKEVTFYGIFFICETHPEVITAWQQATSGIIMPPKGNIVS